MPLTLGACSLAATPGIKLKQADLSWVGELNPTEFLKWEVVATYPNPVHIWIIAKNPDELSKIYFVALIYDMEGTLIQYRYWKESEPHVFVYTKVLNKYTELEIPDWKRKECFKCHKSKLNKEI